MADESRKRPQSVIDPDREAWERAAQENRAQQGDREQGEAAAAQRDAATAKKGGDYVTAAEAVPRGIQALSRDPGDQVIAKRFLKLAGPLGTGLAAAELNALYKIDRAGGMPADEAFVRNAAHFAGGQAGQMAGEAVGALGGARVGSRVPFVGTAAGAVFGAYGGGVTGQVLGEKAGDRFGDAYSSLKQQLHTISRPLYDMDYLLRTRRFGFY